MKKKLFVTMILLAVLVALPAVSFAQVEEEEATSDLAPTGFEQICSAERGLADCVQKIYLFSLALGAFIAVFMIVLAGYKYMTTQGNAQQQENAKESFAAAFIGLIVLFTAFILLRTINPDFTQFNNFSDITTTLPIPTEELSDDTTPPVPTTTVTVSVSPRSATDDQDVTVSWNVAGPGAVVVSGCRITMTGPLPQASDNTQLIGSSNSGSILIESSRTQPGEFSVGVGCTEITGAISRGSAALTVNP